MLSILSVLAAAATGSIAGPFTAGHTAPIFSTIAHSEFCPAGNVTLDLTTGRYSLTARAPRRVCNDATLERPIAKGRLNPAELESVRSTYLRVLTEGLGDRDCLLKEQLDAIVISNGGTPIVVLTDGGGTVAAPQELTCWSKAATALHETLDRVFSSAQQR